MRIIPVPVRDDNYAYLLCDEETKECAAVDPFDPKKVDAAIKREGVKVTALITTHHHFDHSGGNEEFVKSHSGIPVYGSKETPAGTHVVKDRESFKVGKLEITGYHTPCHTQDSICFHATDSKTNQKAVFTGDTLFVGGCGRFFEGTPKEMHQALNQVLRSLPNETIVYPGHEYTKSNIVFGSAIEPDNSRISDLKAFTEGKSSTTPGSLGNAKIGGNEDLQDGRGKVMTTGKSTIADELEWNVFMRLDNPEVQRKTKQTDPVKVMEQLREMKNSGYGS